MTGSTDPDTFYIKNEKRQFWTGRSWSSATQDGRPCFAKPYSYHDGLNVINRRFAKGVVVWVGQDRTVLPPPELVLTTTKYGREPEGDHDNG